MTRKQILMGTAIPQRTPLAQMSDLQKQLTVVLLAWDGVAKAMKEARAQVHG